VNSVGKEFRYRLPKLAANIALALAFGAIGTLSLIVLASVTEDSIILASVTDDFAFYSWLVLTLVGGVFMIRALFDTLTIGDKTVGLFMARLGMQQRLSKSRMAKDLICIIAIILTTVAIFPFLKAIGTIGTILQSVTTIAAIMTIFLFVYDIARTVYEIVHEKASVVADWLVHEPEGEIE